MFEEKIYKEKMSKTIDVFVNELSSLRTGRANANMLDLIKVEVYGQVMPIKQLSSISTPDHQTLSLQVWDQNNVKFIEKSIRESDLNLNPLVDGQIIRVPVPKLSEERRKELTKIVSQQSEKIKISIRNIRREGMDKIKKDNKDKIISDDENKKFANELQKITDNYIKLIEDKIKQKEKDILTV